MRIAANAPQAQHFILIDTDTGEFIPDVIWADDKAGAYRTVERNEMGQVLVVPVLHQGAEHSGLAVRERKGNIRFIPVYQHSIHA